MLPPRQKLTQILQEGPYAQKQHQQYPRATRFLHAASAAAEQRHFQRIQRVPLFNPCRARPRPARDRIPEISEAVMAKKRGVSENVFSDISCPAPQRDRLVPLRSKSDYA